MLKPALRRKRVLIPQMRDDANVDSAVSVT